VRIRKSVGVLLAGLLTATACSTNSLNNNSNFNNLPQETFNSQSVDNLTIEIVLTRKNDLITLGTGGYDIFGYSPDKKTVRARVSKAQAEKIKELGFGYKNIFERNMDIKNLLPGYSTYAQMKQKLNDLAAKYPDLVKLQDIGDTWEKTSGKSPDNDIWNMKITSNKNSGGKTKVLFIGGMHARELAPVEIMLKLTDHLLSQYGKDPAVTELVDSREINIVPMVNVDGRIQVEKGNTWQRKNTNGSGVDLNRNFDSYWNYEGLDVPSSWVRELKNPYGETYSGSSPASEPETKAIQNFVNKERPGLVLDMHAYGEMFMWPVGYTTKPVPEDSVFRNIYNNSFKQIGMKGGSPAVLLYPTTGTSIDYPYIKNKALGVGMEVGTSFRPSFSEVETMWNKQRPHLLHLIKVSNTSLAR